MPSLARELRNDLGNKVREARRIAENGARKVIESLAVHNHEPWGSMSPENRKLRNRLRVHGRQLGDQLDPQRGTQSMDHLVSEVAYEHWHRMLFARFLAENGLLLMPNTTTAITLDEVEEIARDQGRDWLSVVSEYAEKMLPQIFRSGDPTLEVVLSRETRKDLEEIIRGLNVEVFTADDSLGWVYQFWQADKKDEVNASGNKIGADELPAVTQLFTEDYMVDFLLDNTLGAWHASRLLAAEPTLTETAQSEDELRNAVALPGCPWKYLRFIKAKDDRWTPAAGTYDGWPKTAKELKCLDPCMGSGHFVVAVFARLVALRMADEGVEESIAVAAVIHDNLFGLEIDPRCTQIGAFNLALAAWRRVGHCKLPPMHIACSGLAPNAKKEDWLKLAGDDERLQRGMERLYALFRDAPVLGSLINPRAGGGDLLEAEFHELQPLLEKALAREAEDDTAHEMAVTVRGLAEAAEILAEQYTLVATNVPYLGRGKQDTVLREHLEKNYRAGNADLATAFMLRCLELCASGGSLGAVLPQNWLFQVSYTQLRVSIIKLVKLEFVIRLGSNAFQDMNWWAATTSILIASKKTPTSTDVFSSLDASNDKDRNEKNKILRLSTPLLLGQSAQLLNPDASILGVEGKQVDRLSDYAEAPQGIKTGDDSRWLRNLWELKALNQRWQNCQTAVYQTCNFGGASLIVDWGTEGVGMVRPRTDCMALGKRGVAITQTGAHRATLYYGDRFDSNITPIIPNDPNHIAALWAFLSDADYSKELSNLSPGLFTTNSAFLKVPFDLVHWQKVAEEKYPNGLPKPFCSDPTQWLFNGRPNGSDQPLQVAVARLLGYRWPRQAGSSFPDCAPLGPDGLEKLAAEAGIVCLSVTNGEAPGAERLRELLARDWGKDWSAAALGDLLAQVGCAGKTLDDWLRDSFFPQHCEFFHHRPFIWQIWDGRRDGFNALVNYHRFAGPEGEGLRTLDKLIYTYLGAWIERQEIDQKAGVEGADGRLAAAQQLKSELEKIRKGEPPFDIFVRWKSLADQPRGWNPDINDGVRMNIRPFMTARPFGAKAKNACILRSTPRISWDKDRGKEPPRSKDEFPWFWGWDGETKDFAGGKEFDGARWNDLHYSLSTKDRAAKTEDAA